METKGNAEIKAAIDAIDKILAFKEWLPRAAYKYWSNAAGEELFGNLRELDDARESLRQLYVDGRRFEAGAQSR